MWPHPEEANEKVFIISVGLGPGLSITELGEQPENIYTNCNSYITLILTVCVLSYSRCCTHSHMRSTNIVPGRVSIQCIWSMCVEHNCFFSSFILSLCFQVRMTRKLHICPVYFLYMYMATCLSSALTFYADRWTVQMLINSDTV